MATVIQKNYSDLRPIKFNLKDRDRSLDLSIPSKYATAQGNFFLEYNFLANSNDVKNKNYTSNYLTDTKTETDIFDLNFSENLNRSFISSLNFADDSSKYLTILKNNTSLSSTATLLPLSSGDLNLFNTQSFVVDVSSNTLNTQSTCRIWTYDGIYKKYLVQTDENNNTNLDIKFDTINSISDPNYTRATFNVAISNGTALLSLYTNTIYIPSLTAQYIVIPQASTLIAISAFNTVQLSSAPFTFDISNIIDTDYSIYSNNFNYYNSDLTINNSKSIPNQKYNFIFYNKYEQNYLSGSDIIGNLSYFNLKNQISNNYNVNKNLPFKDPQQQRYYTSILNDETSEISEENLKLNYNFYTVEYRFDPDKYTKFKLPDNILPFKSININDANLQGAGAYAANSPYYSDRLYKLLDESNNNTRNEDNGTFLCSWLYDDNVKGIWYDRYYLPNFKSKVSALSGNLNPHTTQIQQISSAFGLGDNNMYYYDVRSTLSLEPSNTYYYARIGKSYITKTLQGVSDRLIKNTFNTRSTDTESILSDQSKIVFDGKSYDEFTFPSLLAADQGSMSISFGLNTPDIVATKAHQLIGNVYNVGMSVLKNFYFTPFAILADGNSLNYYDNNFKLVKRNTFSSITEIKDVCYLTQSGDAVLVCADNTGGRLLRVNYNGDIVRESRHSLSQQLINSNYTSRIFYSIGSRALFRGANGVSFNLDLQTLSIDTLQSGSAESVVLSSASSFGAFISGYRGVNIDGQYAASLSSVATGPAAGGTDVLFTDYSTGEYFSAIQSLTRIYDINAFDNKLYIQTNNKLYVYSTERDLLSTINLSTSAVSGYKIDFISEDYVVNPIVFSRDANSNLIVDKIVTNDNNTVLSYALNISSTDTGWGYEQRPGYFTSPTNLHSLEDTFKEYENKFCFITKFDNEKAEQDEVEIWDDNDTVWNTFESGNWSVNYKGTGATLVDNSSINVIEGIVAGQNCIQLDLDLVTGAVNVYVNGNLTTSFTIYTGIKPLKNYLYNNFYIGIPNFSTGSIIDFKPGSKSLAKNAILKDINIFNTTVDRDILRYLYLKCTEVIDSVNFDVTTSARNNTETINNLYTYNIPGNLSNFITLLIKNGNLSIEDQEIITEKLKIKLAKYLPATVDVSQIEFNYNVGNQLAVDADEPVQLQPTLPITNNPDSNVFNPGNYITFEVTTDLIPVLYDNNGIQLFVMVV
jgi:hypothetical protein